MAGIVVLIVYIKFLKCLNSTKSYSDGVLAQLVCVACDLQSNNNPLSNTLDQIRRLRSLLGQHCSKTREITKEDRIIVEKVSHFLLYFLVLLVCIGKQHNKRENKKTASKQM